MPDAAPSAVRPGLLGRLGIRSKFALAYAVVLLLFGYSSYIYNHSLDEMHEARRWHQHSQIVLQDIDDLLVAALNQETGFRGFVLTRDERFLEPFKLGGPAFDSSLQRLRELTADNPRQQAYLSQLQQVMQRWREEFALPLIEIAHGAAAAGEPRVIAEMQSGRGKRMIDQMRGVFAQMRAHELDLLNQRNGVLERSSEKTQRLTLLMLLAGILFVIAVILIMSRHVAQPIAALTALMARISSGQTDLEIPHKQRGDEVGGIARALEVFRRSTQALREREWLKARVAELAPQLQACESETEFAQLLAQVLCEHTGAICGVVFYWSEPRQQLEVRGGYGIPDAELRNSRFGLGEGLAGQCASALQTITVSPLPGRYLQRSGLGQATPTELVLTPIKGRESLLGVVELALFHPMTPIQYEYFEAALGSAAQSLEVLQRSLRTQELLLETQQHRERLMASEEELRTQQEELRATNEALTDKSRTLEEQGRRLRVSEEESRAQSEELRITNAALEEKTEALNLRTADLERAQTELEARAADLETGSRYKSEFLANMSHELRTPLNSLLILAKGLSENDAGHLDDDEVESARIIHESGSNLLNLINDILDLSKVEAGKLELVVEELSLDAFATQVERNFRHVAEQRGLRFDVLLTPGLPPTLRTDAKRLHQIVSNLLSNAFKFTHEGGVRLHIGRPTAQQAPTRPGLAPESSVAFRVSDSGIGIPAARLGALFQPFEQGESGTSRRYGGTGLGLSICRALSTLLGGEVRADSSEGKGSSFTLILPETLNLTGLAAAMPQPERASEASAATSVSTASMTQSPVPAGAGHGAAHARSLLIIEDDARFAAVLAGIVRARGYEALIAGDGERGLALAQQMQPGGILLDIGLPGMDGWAVMERLKADPRTARIPVHFISGDDQRGRGLAMGAVGFLVKPASKQSITEALARVMPAAVGKAARRMLLVDGDDAARNAVAATLESTSASLVSAASGAQGLKHLAAGGFDCVILDLVLPDMSGLDFLSRAAAQSPLPPVVIHSSRELTRDEDLKLREYTDAVVIRGSRSQERLLDEVTLFLHAIRKTAEPAPAPRAPVLGLDGKTVLVVDDDMRNIFALSKVLRTRGLKVIMAQDGRKAITQLESHPETALVLMDIMMPGLDGYDTMRLIRERAPWQKLPIIAVTAKAMKGDREKCLEAGADDYCAKPIDVEHLLTLMSRLLS